MYISARSFAVMHHTKVQLCNLLTKGIVPAILGLFYDRVQFRRPKCRIFSQDGTIDSGSLVSSQIQSYKSPGVTCLVRFEQHHNSSALTVLCNIFWGISVHRFTI